MASEKTSDKKGNAKTADVGKKNNKATDAEKKNNDRATALDAALKQIEKSFGKGSVMKLGSSAKQMVDVIPTGCLPLDIALGVGGIPRGRIIEIYGPESSGKTTLALHIAAEAQKMGGIAAFIDAEHALDPVYASNLGIDLDELLVSQPDSGEQALEIAEALVRSGAVDVVVVDSVAALVPRAELEGEMGDTHVGLQARLMSQALRKLTGAVNKSRTAIVFINQLREKIGVMFGNPETTAGGRALKYYATVRIDIRRTETLKQGSDMVGNRTKAKVVKNKVAPPFKIAEFDIVFGEGISQAGSLLDLGVNLDVIKKSGSWFSYKDEKIGQGRENAKKYLNNNPDIFAEVEAKVRELSVNSNRIAFGTEEDETENDSAEVENVAVENDAVAVENDAIEVENDVIEVENDAIEMENDLAEAGDE